MSAAESTPISVGRCGLGTSAGGDGLVLVRGAWDSEGDKSTVDLIIRGQSTDDDAKAMRDQLLGYDLNPDEPVVPVVDSADTTRTGFYRVQRIRQAPELTGREGSGAKNIAYRLTADLLRVPGWQAPLFEVVCSGTVRSNAHSITTAADPWVAIPGDAVAISYDAAVSGSPSSPTSTATGNVLWLTDTGSDLYDAATSYSIPASGMYAAACQVQATTDGGTSWRTVTGRQILNDPDGWRISNGRVRLSIVNTDNFRIEWYDSGSWEATDFEVYANSSPQWVPNAVTVLSNSVDCVSVRVHLTHASVVGPALDFTVRRGSTWIEGRGSSVHGWKWGVFRTATEAGTSITGGITATSNNVAGNKYVILTPLAFSADTTAGGLETTATDLTSFPFAFSAVNVGVNGSSATSVHYFAAMNHRQRIVAR